MVSDERALAVRLASTEDDALARTFAERGVAASAALARLLRRRCRDAGSGVRRARGRTAPPHVARRPRSPPSTARPCAASELAVLRPLALVGDDGAPYGAVAARVRTASIARPDAFVTEPPAPPVVAAERLRRRRCGRARLHDRRRIGRRAAGGPAHAAVAHGHRCGQRDRSASTDGCRSPRVGGRHRRPGRRRRRRRPRDAAGSRVDRHRRGHAVARSDHHPTLGGRRGGAARTPCRRVCAPTTAASGRSASWAGAYPLHAEWTERAARLRRIAESLGPAHRRRAPSRRGPRRCGPAPAPTPTAWRRTCPPRSTACTCRPT